MMRLEAMAIFAQVAESGSFTGAARLLGLPKSTMSQRVAELEADLDLRLLHRTTRKLSLTEAGRIYLEHCQTMLAAARAADAAASRLRDTPSGTLRITTPEATGIKLLPALLAAFRREHPHISVQCVVTDAHLDLVGDRIDLALRTGQLHDSSFISRRIGHVRRVLVASPGYLSIHGRPQSPTSLRQHQCLMHQSAPQWMLHTESGPVLVATPSGANTSNSLLYLLQAALLDGGIAMLPAFTCRDELLQGRLELVLPVYPPIPSDYYVVYPSRSHPSAALLALLDFLARWGLADAIG